MQPSEYEIQREVEALRDIRRRSSTQGGPGSLILDPDLPTGSAQSLTQAPYWSPHDDSSSSSHEDSSDNGSTSAENDPFHLFWVPARLHPEIAPAEFRAFLKEHAPTPGEGSLLERSISVGSLGRKRSMLSRQYKPSANDGVEEEEVVPVQRKRTSVFATSGPQLTISDLQMLEELAEEASQSDDPSKLRSILRRSLSFNVAPSVIDQMDDIPELGEDVDSPIIVPPPGGILRRTQRTKIRKAGQTTEGAHRFTTTRTRRKSLGTRAPPVDPRSSSDMSSSDHGDSDVARWPRANVDISAPFIVPRPESYSEEQMIYDAYAGDDTEEPQSRSSESPEPIPEEQVPPTLQPPALSLPEPAEPVVEASSTVSLVIYQPQPQRIISPSTAEPISPLLTSSPEPTVSPPSTFPARPQLQEAPAFQPPSPVPSEQRREKEKDKKGLFKWGSDKGSKKGQKEKDLREREKEKDSGFFGSLFGSKKKAEDTPPPVIGTGHGREAAAALLGASKSSKNYIPPPSPQPVGAYARYPIHVERAIYRLSHIKLANPRRPLYEQVLISNLMFWYLGVINKAQSPTTTPGNGNAPEADKESPAKEQIEQKEHDEREKAEERAEQKRRGSLTKSPPTGSVAPGARKAETPVRGPQYEMQHRAMEQEYGFGHQANGNGQAPVRTSSAPPAPMPSLGGYSRPQSAQQYSTQIAQPQPQLPNNRFYQSSHNVGPPSSQYPGMGVPASQLPPGAMPLAAVEQIWSAAGSSAAPPANRAGSSPPPRATSPSANSVSSPRRARSPPTPTRYTPAQEKQPNIPAARLPGRSLSATVSPPVQPLGTQVNGKLRKGLSAHAVVQNHRHSNEEEDVPLALYQQQRRK